MTTTDDELLAEVRAALHEEVADVTAGPAMLAAVRRKQARRVLTSRFALVASVAAAAAVAVAVVALPAEESMDPVNAAHVREMTIAALDEAKDDVVYERTIVTEGDVYSEPGQEALYEQWRAADGSTYRWRVTVDGEPVEDLSRDPTGNIYVDFRDRTFRTLGPKNAPLLTQDDVLTPTQIQQALEDGRITVVGQETINGKPVVKLHRKPEGTNPPMDLWVDTTTYLPVRSQWLRESPRESYMPIAPYAPFDVSWLPPTPENLAKLKTVVPPGFTEKK